MQSVVYIYTRTGTTPIYQLFDPMNLSISRKLSEISTAQFDITVFDEVGKLSWVLVDPTYIVEKNRIKIGVIHNGIETIEFDGYITSISDTPMSTHIICSDLLHLLDERMILIDTTVSGVLGGSVASILSTINTLENTGITVATSSLTQTYAKTYTAFTKVIDIIKDLADQGGGNQIFFYVQGGVLYFDSVIGSDLSATVEFNYEYRDSYYRSIETFSFESDIKAVENAVYTKNTSNVVSSASDSASIAQYGRIENGISLGTGTTPAIEVANALAKTKDITRTISITPTTTSYSLANPGDIVRVYIDRGDIRGQYNGTMRVTGKEYVAGDIPQIQYTLSNSQVKSLTILDKIGEMNSYIERIKIGTIS